MYRRELSYENVWLCMQVIFIHVASGVVGANGAASLLFVPQRLATFVVQGFLFLSALRTFYWYRDNKLDYLPYYWSRVTRIILPYVVINALYVHFFAEIEWIDFSWKELFRYTVHGDIAAPFYFIIIILQMYLLMPLWRVMVRRIPVVIGIGGALALTLIYKELLLPAYETTRLADFLYPGNVLLYYLIFWVAGCYAGQYYEAWLDLLKRKWLTLLMSLLLVITACLDIRWLKEGRGMIRLERTHMLYCLLAIWVLSAICLGIAALRNRHRNREGTRQPGGLSGEKIRRSGILSRLVTAIDQASFEIYLIHCLVLSYLSIKFLPDHWIVAADDQLPYLVPGVYGISIALSIIWVKGKSYLFRKKGNSASVNEDAAESE